MGTRMRFPATPRVLAAGAVLAWALAFAVPAAAQESDGPARFCRTGRPIAECETFLVATLNYYPDPQGTRYTPWEVVEWEFGMMVNRGSSDAVGASLAVGTSEMGFHLAARGRYRRWLARGMALDAGAGFIVAQHPPRVYPHQTITGLTGGVAVGLTDWIAVSAQGRVLWGATEGTPVAEVEAGVRLGTLPGMITTVLGSAYLLSSAMRGS